MPDAPRPMPRSVVYFDHAAATPVDERVLEAMLPYFRERFGNPQSIYSLGAQAKAGLDQAREQVARLIQAQPEEITFTASGTESNNLALQGLARARQDKGRHIIVSAVEHVSIINVCRALNRQGFEITFLPVDGFGLVDLEVLRTSLRKDTILVSVQAANNEVGTIQPMPEAGQMARAAGAVFHTDAVAAAGVIPLNVAAMNIDALSLAAPTFYGPRGAAALYVRKGVRILPLMEGGNQEAGRRPGSEDVAALVGMGRAAALARAEMAGRAASLQALRERLLVELPARIDHVHITGHRDQRLPGHASFCIEFVEGEALLLFLEDAGFCVASGSACTSKALRASHVLLAMGLPHSLAQGSLMLTLGQENTMAEVDALLEHLPVIVTRLREMSPLYAQFLRDPVGYEARLREEKACIARK